MCALSLSLSLIPHKPNTRRMTLHYLIPTKQLSVFIRGFTLNSTMQFGLNIELSNPCRDFLLKCGSTLYKCTWKWYETFPRLVQVCHNLPILHGVYTVKPVFCDTLHCPITCLERLPCDDILSIWQCLWYTSNGKPPVLRGHLSVVRGVASPNRFYSTSWSLGDKKKKSL